MLSSFITILRFEIAKAIRTKTTWATILLPALVAALSVWVHFLSQNVQQALGDESQSVASAYLGFAKGASNGFILGGILLLLYSSMLMANEGSWKTFKTIMLRPHRRFFWILGKFTLLLLIIIALIIAVAGAAFVMGAIMADYSAIAEEGYVFLEAEVMAELSVQALLLVVLPLIALAAFGLMFSTMTDHTGIAASLALGAYIIMETAKEAMGAKQTFLFNTFVPSLLDTSFFVELRDFAEGMSDAGWDPSLYTFNVGTPLASAAIFLIVAQVVFTRRDFTL